MAETAPVINLTSERIRGAAKHLEQDSLGVKGDLQRDSIYFKLVAEEMERENDSEAVATLRQGLLEVLNCAHRLDHQCSALQKLSHNFEARTELTDFSKHLNESTRELLAANPFDPTKEKLFHQFDQAIWNVHHAGEAAPGQEEEEIVMINENGLKNTTCPLTGKPVVELDVPVRSTECHHIYEQAALLVYIAQHAASRKRCRCAVAGCTSDLRKDNFNRDMSLNMEIQEHRLRENATQRVDYVDYTVDIED